MDVVDSKRICRRATRRRAASARTSLTRAAGVPPTCCSSSRTTGRRPGARPSRRRTRERRSRQESSRLAVDDHRRGRPTSRPSRGSRACRSSSPRSSAPTRCYCVVRSRSICINRTMRSGSGYGSGLSSTPSTTLKTAVAAPMPRPSVRIETSAKPWRAHEQARRRSAGRAEVFEKAGAKLVARGFLHLLDAAEAQQRRSPRLLRRHARTDVLGGLLLDMKTDLLVEPALDPRASEGAIRRVSSACGSIGPPQADVSRIRLTARDRRCQCVSSSSKCRRPAAVSA